MTYRGQEAREALMGDIAGAFADAMDQAQDKDRVALLQSRIEAAIIERLDCIYPTLEDAKAVRVLPTLAGVKGPDGEQISAWLTHHGVDPVWMVLGPFTVDYEDGFIDYEAYVHTDAGEIVYGRDQEPRKQPRTARLRDATRLPDLENIRVERLR